MSRGSKPWPQSRPWPTDWTQNTVAARGLAYQRKPRKSLRLVGALVAAVTFTVSKVIRK